MAAAKKSATSIQSDWASGPCIPSGSGEIRERADKGLEDGRIGADEPRHGVCLLRAQASSAQSGHHAFGSGRRITLDFRICEPGRSAGFVLARFDVEVGPRHHGDGGRSRA